MMTNNQVVGRLLGESYAALAPHMRREALRRDQVVEAAGEIITKVYFPETAVLSLTAALEDGKTLDAAFIGFEGLSGISLIVGNELAVYSKIVRISGTALRIPADIFLSALDEAPQLRMRLLKYVESLRYHVAVAAASAAHMRLEARLARALLMLQDRTDEGPVRVTHESLASILGATRPAVTTACKDLDNRALIRCGRRKIEVLDRDGLIALSNGSYGQAEAHHRRLHQELGGVA